jgi:hypothetical protein
VAIPTNVGKQAVDSGVKILERESASVNEAKLARERSEHERATVAPVKTDGIVSRTLAITLRRNALVERFDVVVQALRADATVLANCAQVRTQDEGADLITVVADFGLPHTVTTVGALSSAKNSIQVASVKAWTGMQFADAPVYSAVMASSRVTKKTELKVKPPSTEEQAIFPEVRTERLMVLLVTDATAKQIAEDLWVRLPDLPADLELRIGGGRRRGRRPGPCSPAPAGSTPRVAGRSRWARRWPS